MPAVFSSIFVKPNEISLEAPYIDAHIKATRIAYGLESKLNEIDFETSPESTLDVNKNKDLLDNVRLWDWQPFHDTVTQTQALRPYYVFNGTDVDRYTIDGKFRQVLLSPRELDINQLPAGAASSWVNRHFTYTHGYGLVLAEVSKITPEGLPSYLIENMPLQIRTPSLKVDTAGTLLRRDAGRPGVRAHGTALKPRARTSSRTTKATAVFPCRRCSCAWRRRCSRATPTSCSPVI